MPPRTWKKLCSGFSLKQTLFCGQVFRWKELSAGEYVGVVGHQVVAMRQRGNADIEYQVWVPSRSSRVGVEEALRDYFNLHIDVEMLQAQWGKGKVGEGGSPVLMEHFRDTVKNSKDAVFIRVIRQQPEECLLSFICSQNNNVKRISGMIEKLCVGYGESLGEVGGQEWHAFPTVDRLLEVEDFEEKLTEMGFGYRAKYIASVVEKLKEDEDTHPLLSLRDVPFAKARSYLTTLPGVGPKVADCVALFSLDQHSLTPVDTHVSRLAKLYLSNEIAFTTKSLTPKTYAAIQSAFEATFGPYAGWAHTLLFHAELATPPSKRKKADEGNPPDEGKSKKKTKKK